MSAASLSGRGPLVPLPFRRRPLPTSQGGTGSRSVSSQAFRPARSGGQERAVAAVSPEFQQIIWPRQRRWEPLRSTRARRPRTESIRTRSRACRGSDTPAGVRSADNASRRLFRQRHNGHHPVARWEARSHLVLYADHPVMPRCPAAYVVGPGDPGCPRPIGLTESA